MADCMKCDFGTGECTCGNARADELNAALSGTAHSAGSLQPLFDLMQNEHGLTLTESELQDIIRVAQNEKK